ncbi:MAG: STY0301 family protein [Pseudomonadota bacterium]
MSSNKSALFLALAWAMCWARAEPKAVCPQKVPVDGIVRPLVNASLFDGPPEALVELMPDLSNSVWNLGSFQHAQRERKTHFYLVCQYKGSEKQVILEIPYSAKFCAIEGIRGGIMAACR